MRISIEGKQTYIGAIESNRTIIVSDSDEGSNFTLFFPGGSASSALTLEETKTLITALELAISTTESV